MTLELPTTKINRKWSFIYAYNLKTLRDIFIYCNLKKEIDEKKLYADMAENIIALPGKKWINEKIKRKERLRHEYIHAAEYLKLIRRENGMVYTDLVNFSAEKKILIESNKNRKFEPSGDSIELNSSEKEAFLNIIFGYERARDYLYWFLDSEEYKNSDSFTLRDYKKKAKPIFLSGKTAANKKGSDTLKKNQHDEAYKIPDRYIRLANTLFPSWFIELGLIDKITIFPDFSEDKKLWHMFYPIKMNDAEFLKKDLSVILERNFLGNADSKRIWLPYLIYFLALNFGCTTKVIKLALEKCYKEDYEHFYLERTSLSLMKRHSQYKESYLVIDGFFRSSLLLKRRIHI